MITPPAEPPTWGQCVLTVERHILRPERRAFKFAARKLNRVTGLRFRFVKTGGQIKVTYDQTHTRYTGWTAIQGDPIFWAGITLNPDHLRTRVERRATVMHELAHAVGVGHNYTDPLSVMWPWQNNVVKWTRDDRRALKQAATCPRIPHARTRKG